MQGAVTIVEEDLPDEQNSFNIWESDQDLDPESVDFDSEAMHGDDGTVTSDLDWTQYRESRGRARTRTPRSASRACDQC